MSIEARRRLVDDEHTIFRSASQRDDLLDPSKTETELVALLIELCAHGFYFVFTAIKSDHHDDSALGRHCHFNGFCADVWPLRSAIATDYVDAGAPEFLDFLEVAARSPWINNVGLAGSACSQTNFQALGSCGFVDEGGDHVHLSAIG